MMGCMIIWKEGVGVMVVGDSALWMDVLRDHDEGSLFDVERCQSDDDKHLQEQSACQPTQSQLNLHGKCYMSTHQFDLPSCTT